MIFFKEQKKEFFVPLQRINLLILALNNYILSVGGGSPWTGKDVKGDTRRLAVVLGASIRRVAVRCVGQLPAKMAGCLARTLLVVLRVLER